MVVVMRRRNTPCIAPLTLDASGLCGRDTAQRSG